MVGAPRIRRQGRVGWCALQSSTPSRRPPRTARRSLVRGCRRPEFRNSATFARVLTRVPRKTAQATHTRVPGRAGSHSRSTARTAAGRRGTRPGVRGAEFAHRSHRNWKWVWMIFGASVWGSWHQLSARTGPQMRFGDVTSLVSMSRGDDADARARVTRIGRSEKHIIFYLFLASIFARVFS